MDTIAPPDFDQETAINGILDSTTEPIYLLRPSPEIVSAFVRRATGEPSSPVIHVLAAEDDLQEVGRQFSISSIAADLIAGGGLTLTSDAPSGRGALALTETTIYSISHVEDRLFVCEMDDDPGKLRKICGTAQGTQPFDLRTPNWTQTVETLEETFSKEVREDFATAVTKAASMEEQSNVDEAVIALLIAAKHELLLYDISRWGEDIKLCSRATLSRVKGQLEDHEIIESTKVPIDVGRPRLRLKLAEPYSSSSISELLEKVTGTMVS